MILCISSTNENSFLGLYHKDILITEKFCEQKNTCEILPILMNNILKEQKISIQNLNSIYCNIGPGNYTSNRISAIFAFGLALPYDIPIFTVTSCEIISVINNTEMIITCIMAKKEEYYCQVFEKQIAKSSILTITKDQIIHMARKYQCKYIITNNSMLKIENINILYNYINNENLYLAAKIYGKKNNIIEIAYYNDAIREN